MMNCQEEEHRTERGAIVRREEKARAMVLSQLKEIEG